MKKALAGLCLLVGSSGVQAYGLDFALSNETANLDVLFNPQSFQRVDGSELAVGGFISEAGDSLAHATLMARGHRRTENSMYNLGAGIKAIGGDIQIPDGAVADNGEDTESVGAVAIGFQVGLLFASRYNPMELSFAAFLAPSITSFSDAERYSEFSTRLQIEVIPQAQAYIGYRRIRFDTNDYDSVGIDRSVHLGIKLNF